MNPVEGVAQSILNSHHASRVAAGRASRINAERAEARRRARQVLEDRAIDKADPGAATGDVKHAPSRGDEHAQHDERLDLTA